MIKKLIGAAFFILVGAVLAYIALSNHIVVTDNDTLFISKSELAIKDSYVNVTEWSAEDFAEHPELVKALFKAGHGDVVPKQTLDAIGDAVKGAMDKILGRQDP